MCSVLWCRQTPGGLHHPRSKAQGDTIPSDPFLSLQAANMAAGLLYFCCSLGRTQAPCPVDWQTNRLCAQFLSAGRPLEVCTPRDLKLRVIQYLVTLFCPGRQRILLQEILSSFLKEYFSSPCCPFHRDVRPWNPPMSQLMIKIWNNGVTSTVQYEARYQSGLRCQSEVKYQPQARYQSEVQCWSEVSSETR